jgi:hypothetical protein
VLEGIAASIGSIGDAYDCASSTTSNTPPWKGSTGNNRRLHGQLNYIASDEYEAAYYASPSGIQGSDV